MAQGPYRGRAFLALTGSFLAAALAACGVAAPTGEVSEADMARGAQRFSTLPCAGCHGATAEGSFGPPLAGTTLTFEQVRQQVRQPRDKMPSFSPDVVSDEELWLIHAWLTTLPRPPSTPQAKLPPADATISARNRLFPEMSAAALAQRVATLDELALRLNGEIMAIEAGERFTEIRFRVSGEAVTLEVLGVYDTAMARQPFPAAVRDHVTLYCVGADPVEIPLAGSGQTQLIPKVQILFVESG